MNGNRMTEGTPWKHILKFALPVLAGNALQQLYNTVDSLITYHYLSGEDADSSQGKIIDKFRKATVLQISTKEHEQENIGSGNADARAQDALGAPELGNEHAFEQEAIMSEVARQIFAEPVIA